jgi:hypothetical protein
MNTGRFVDIVAGCAPGGPRSLKRTAASQCLESSYGC